MPKVTNRYTIEGRIKGIGFNYATRQIALGFDVIGWIKHLPTGSIELVLEGDNTEVQEFIIELTEESNLSHHIKNIDIEHLPQLKNVTGFSIIK